TRHRGNTVTAPARVGGTFEAGAPVAGQRAIVGEERRAPRRSTAHPRSRMTGYRPCTARRQRSLHHHSSRRAVAAALDVAGGSGTLRFAPGHLAGAVDRLRSAAGRAARQYHPLPLHDPDAGRRLPRETDGRRGSGRSPPDRYPTIDWGAGLRYRGAAARSSVGCVVTGSVRLAKTRSPAPLLVTDPLIQW